MSFTRLWTAALAGIALALSMTLCLIAIGSLFETVAPVSRDGSTPIFLGLWAAGTFLCAIPRRQLRQWLIAIWASVGALALTAILYGLIAGAATPALVAASVALLLTLLARALKPTDGA
jgi:hypothetical protein